MTEVVDRERRETPLPTCSCGHDRNHHAVDAKRKFGVWSWILLFAGGSATPKRIIFRCRHCGEIVQTTENPELLRKYRQ